MTNTTTVETINNNITVDSSTSNTAAVETTNNTITIDGDGCPSVTIEQANTSVSVENNTTGVISVTQPENTIAISGAVTISGVIANNTIAVASAEDISANDLVAINSNGEAELADNSDLTQIGYSFGFAQEAVVEGQSVTVILGGLISTTGLTLGKTIFVGTSGGITQTVPITGYLKTVGKTLTATRFFIDLGNSKIRA